MKYSGLSEKEVVRNRECHGSNRVTKVKGNTFWRLFIESLGDPIIKILLIALVIKLFFIFNKYDIFESIGILIAVLLASLISTLSELGSESAFKTLFSELDKIKVKVFRNNNLDEIDSDLIVVEDIIKLTSGDKIVADGYLLEGNISVDESSLTGESKEINKNKNSEVFKGTIVVSGSGVMKVTSVGDNTIVGGISKEIQENEGESTLKLRLYGLAKIISKIGYIGAFIVSISFLINKIVIENDFDISLIKNTIMNTHLMINYLIYALTLSVTIIIVAVPEGLPMMITLVLSSNMKRMMKDNVLVRKLTGIETSGNLNYLLTDKTGTLTKGELSVTEFISGDLKHFKKSDSIPSKIKDIIYESVVINNECVINNNKIIGGNSTDKALIKYFKYNKDYQKKIVDRINFNSDNKYSVVKFQDYSLIKGASEVLLDKCNKVLTSFNKIENIDKIKIEREIKVNTEKGIRVLTLVKKVQNDYIFLGLILIRDELRKEAKEGINLIKNAGINVIMITGDHYLTAKSIAIDSGVITKKDDLVITSDDLKKMDDEDIKKIISKIKVVARALPSDKSRLVRILKELNQVVGMTGDGVNDAPALRQANVGFSMGSGSEVAKEASDIVIVDDNILSISKAILYGRTTLKSIRKFIVYQLTVNMTALTISILGSFIGVSTPITIIQMLWLNMIMDSFAGLAFSFEPPLKYYMEESPGKVEDPIINRYMYSQIIYLTIVSSLLCIVFLKCPFILNFISRDPKTFMTAYFALFIFIGVFNSYNARSERLNIFSNLIKNKVFIIISIFIICTQIFLIYHGGDLFRTYGLLKRELLFVILMSLSVIPLDFIRKIYLKKKGYKLGY